MKWITLLPLVIYSFILSNENEEFTDPRDQNVYEVIELNGLNWMTENLRYKTENSLCPTNSEDSCPTCGEFYLVEEALTICPEGWRLPTPDDMKKLLKLEKRKKLDLVNSLSISLCGRVENKVHSKLGEQVTYWLEAPLKDGFITHWHVFGDEHEIHEHNVVNAKRQFPVRCVCELD